MGRGLRQRRRDEAPATSREPFPWHAIRTAAIALLGLALIIYIPLYATLRVSGLVDINYEFRQAYLKPPCRWLGPALHPGFAIEHALLAPPQPSHASGAAVPGMMIVCFIDGTRTYHY